MNGSEGGGFKGIKKGLLRRRQTFFHTEHSEKREDIIVQAERIDE